MAWTRLDDVNSFGNFVISYGHSNIYGAGRYNQVSAAFAAAYVGTNPLSRIVRYRTYTQAQGEWVHLAMTYDGAVGRLFIDGREIDAVAGDWSIEPGAVAAIGRLINTGGTGKVTWTKSGCTTRRWILSRLTECSAMIQ